MKKIFAVLIAILLCFGSVTTVAFAENEAIIASVSVSKSELIRGDVFDVDINLDLNQGFVNLGVRFAYDSDVLEMVCDDHDPSYHCLPVVWQLGRMNNSSNVAANSQYHYVNPYRINWAYGYAKQDITYTGKIATLRFKVKEDAPSGKSSLSVTIGEASNNAGKKPKGKGGSATINISDKSHIADTPVVIPATCTKDGSETVKCKLCGEVLSKTTLKATGHDWGSWKSDSNAKCGEKGVQSRTCKRKDCGKTETKSTNALDHSWDNGTVVKKVTCTEDGSTLFKCTRDGCDGSKTETFKATGHNFGEWKQVTKPDCEGKGSETRICSNDKSHTETREIEPLGHKVDWQITKEPTTSEAGERMGVCSVCEKSLIKEIPKLTRVIKEDKLQLIIVDGESGKSTEGSATGFKIEASDGKPFSGFVEGSIKGVIPTKDKVSTIDGKKVAIAYTITLADLDTKESVPADKRITLTLPIGEDILNSYENLVLVGIDENGKDLRFEDAKLLNDTFVVTGSYAELDNIAIAGDELTDKVGDDPYNSEDSSSVPQSVKIIILVVVMVAALGTVLIVMIRRYR